MIKQRSDGPVASPYALMTLRRVLPVAMAVVTLLLGVQEVHAQAQGASLPSSTTIVILVALSLVATLLIALRFRWIQVSATSGPSWIPRSAHPAAHTESTGELSDKIFGEVRKGLESTRDVLVHQKEVLLSERDRLREARSEAKQDAQGYLDAMAELKRSRAQVEDLGWELARLNERFNLAKDENARIRSDLENQRSELEQVRARLNAERQQVARLQLEVQREQAEVDRATSEVAKEWEFLQIRKEEIDQARRELYESVLALSKSREQLVAEIQAGASLWGSVLKREASG
jgi:hypothetical protein